MGISQLILIDKGLVVDIVHHVVQVTIIIQVNIGSALRYGRNRHSGRAGYIGKTR